MDICNSCNNHFNIQKQNFYKNHYDNLCDIFKNTLINDHNILNEIFNFLTYKNHIVTHQKKRRIIPTPEQEEDSDFDDEVYWNETKNICTFCFQSGIIESLEVQKRLPFLRRDIYFFINEDRNFEECLKNYKNKYNNFYLYYDLPKHYDNTYYRQSQPELKNNRFIIKKM